MVRLFVFQVVVFALIYLFFYLFGKINGGGELERKRYDYLLIFFIILLGGVVFLIAINRGFSIDEFEHIHSAWYVEHHQVPYKDFFQHHHPLLWYLILPFLWIFGHTVTVVLILRFFMFLFTLGIGYLVYRISRKLSGSREMGLLSVILLFSNVMFVVFSINIRPDVPQVFFGLLSVYLLVGFFSYGSRKYIISSGLCAAVSFLFLQKTIFLLLGIGIFFLWMLIKRSMSLSDLLSFAFAFSVPCIIYLLYLIQSNSLGDYMLTNWILNMNFAKGDRFSLFRTLNFYILKDFFFWILAGFSFFYIIKHKIKEIGLLFVTVISGVLFLTLFFIKRPWGHNFIFPLCALSILAGYALYQFFFKFQLKPSLRLICVMLVILSSSYFLIERGLDNNSQELKRVDYVLENSKDTDFIYDGKNQFNLFRPDLHYFWFSLKKSHGLDTYNRLTHNVFGDYNICELVKTKKPKFISGFRLDVKACGLLKVYGKTGFDNLFIRIEEN
jgi:4-amino-4-deoxy-L-arabinose transferase-like glycosyltransferase